MDSVTTPWRWRQYFPGNIGLSLGVIFIALPDLGKEFSFVERH
jgi:hypothetical protein